MPLFEPILLDVANKEFQDQLDRIPDTQTDTAKAVKNTGQLIGITPNHAFFQALNHLNRIATILGILAILIGIFLMVRSNIGNNGKSRRSSAAWIFGGSLSILLIRILPILAISMGQLDHGRLLSFVFTLTTQSVFFVGSILMYMFASQWLQLYEFSSQQSLLRRSEKAYKSMTLVMIIGSFLYVIMEVLSL